MLLDLCSETLVYVKHGNIESIKRKRAAETIENITDITVRTKVNEKETERKIDIIRIRNMRNSKKGRNPE